MKGVLAMKQQHFLQLGAAGAASASASQALAHYQSSDLNVDTSDLAATVARLRRQFQASFDAAYVDHVIIPHFLVSIYGGERPSLPMIDVKLTKENALPYDLWGMLSESWKPKS